MSASALPSRTPTLHEGHSELVTSEVNVDRAEQAFHTLERVATNQSRHEIAKKKSKSSLSKKALEAGYDEEKGELPPDEEPFNLREYLSSSNDKAMQHGLKHKHVGVTWEDLQVDVIGGVDHKVCNLFLYCRKTC